MPPVNIPNGWGTTFLTTLLRSGGVRVAGDAGGGGPSLWANGGRGGALTNVVGEGALGFGAGGGGGGERFLSYPSGGNGGDWFIKLYY